MERGSGARAELLPCCWSRRHLAKSAEQIKKEQAATLAAVQKKIGSAKVSAPASVTCWGETCDVRLHASRCQQDTATAATAVALCATGSLNKL